MKQVHFQTPIAVFFSYLVRLKGTRLIEQPFAVATHPVAASGEVRRKTQGSRKDTHKILKPIVRSYSTCVEVRAGLPGRMGYKRLMHFGGLKRVNLVTYLAPYSAAATEEDRLTGTQTDKQTDGLKGRKKDLWLLQHTQF